MAPARDGRASGRPLYLLLVLQDSRNKASEVSEKLKRRGIDGVIASTFEEVTELFESGVGIVILPMDATELRTRRIIELIRDKVEDCIIVVAGGELSKENLLSLMEVGVTKFLGGTVSAEKIAREVESLISSVR